MPQVTIDFIGICTHVNWHQLVSPQPEILLGRRIVLVNGNPLAIASNPHLNDLEHPIPPHYAQLMVPASSSIVGPAGPLFQPSPDPGHVTLTLNIVGMDPFLPGQPPVIGLTGATLQLVNGVGAFADEAGCIPHLSATVPSARPGPHVTDKVSSKVSCYFDIAAGTLAGLQTREHGGAAFAQLTATTVTAPQILITPWDGTAPTLVTLPDDDLPVAVFNSPITMGEEFIDHFLLHFVATDDNWPPHGATLDVLSACPVEGVPWEVGPGCSNSNIP